MSAELVLAIHPRHSRSILSGDKAGELRRRFPSVDSGARIYLYETAPTCAIVGGFELREVTRAAPEELWKVGEVVLCIKREEFDAYLAGVAQAALVWVGQPFWLRRPVDRRELGAIGAFAPPQSLSYIRSPRLANHLAQLQLRPLPLLPSPPS